MEKAVAINKISETMEKEVSGDEVLGMLMCVVYIDKETSKMKTGLMLNSQLSFEYMMNESISAIGKMKGKMEGKE